jgi:hypothetical protein
MAKGDMVEIGATGLKRTGGYIQEEFLQELRGQRGAKVYREMADNSAVLGGCLYAIEQLISGVDWRVDPVEQKDTKSQEYAEFIKGAMDDMSRSWEECVSEILSMLVYGYAPMEIVYKRRQGPDADPASKYKDGAIGWRKIALRKQESIVRWEFEDEGGLKAVVQQPAPDYIERVIPIEKFLLFRTKADGNDPQGRSILRSAYYSYYFAKKLIEISAVGAERNLVNIPVGRVPGSALAAEAATQEAAAADAMREIVERLHQHEQASIVISSDLGEGGQKVYDVELLKAGGSSQTMDVKSLIEHFELREAMALLMDVLLIGHEGSGSYALSSNRTELVTRALNAILDKVASVFNRHGIPRLGKLNGWDEEKYPLLAHADVQTADLAGITAFLEGMAKAGVDVFPDEELTRYLYGLARFPIAGREQIEREGGRPQVQEPAPKGKPEPDEEPEEEVGKWSPDQPREPSGVPEGGQFASTTATGRLSRQAAKLREMAGIDREDPETWLVSSEERKILSYAGDPKTDDPPEEVWTGAEKARYSELGEATLSGEFGDPGQAAEYRAMASEGWRRVEAIREKAEANHRRLDALLAQARELARQMRKTEDDLPPERWGEAMAFIAECRSPKAPDVAKYSPDQPRVPAGSPEGGEWGEGGGGTRGVVNQIIPLIPEIERAQNAGEGMEVSVTILDGKVLHSVSGDELAGRKAVSRGSRWLPEDVTEEQRTRAIELHTHPWEQYGERVSGPSDADLLSWGNDVQTGRWRGGFGLLDGEHVWIIGRGFEESHVQPITGQVFRGSPAAIIINRISDLMSSEKITRSEAAHRALSEASQRYGFEYSRTEREDTKLAYGRIIAKVSKTKPDEKQP